MGHKCICILQLCSDLCTDLVFLSLDLFLLFHLVWTLVQEEMVVTHSLCRVNMPMFGHTHITNFNDVLFWSCIVTAYYRGKLLRCKFHSYNDLWNITNQAGYKFLNLVCFLWKLWKFFVTRETGKLKACHSLAQSF